MKFQTTNTSVMVLFWIDSMLVFKVLWNGEVVGRKLVPKEGTNQHFLAKQ